MKPMPTLPPCLTRRSFLTSSAAALCGSLAAPLARPQNAASKRPASGSHEAMRELYHSFTAEQRKAVCFDWDYRVDIKYGRKPLHFADPKGVLLRAHMTHMPTDITLWAQISGGAFWLFSFFMITDPKTSPSSTKHMIIFGAAIAAVDVWLQLNTAVFSLVWALFLVCTLRAVWTMARDLRAARFNGLPASAPAALQETAI